MFFGLRLPGPFRIGMSSKGRIYGGVTLGPLSVSAPLSDSKAASARYPVWPLTVAQAAEQARRAGWRVTYCDPQVAALRRGLRAAEVHAVRGGVTVRQVTSERTILLWFGVVAAVVLSCMFFAYADVWFG